MTLSHLISGARTCTWQTELPSLSSPLCFTVIEPSAVSLPFAFAEPESSISISELLIYVTFETVLPSSASPRTMSAAEIPDLKLAVGSSPFGRSYPYRLHAGTVCVAVSRDVAVYLVSGIARREKENTEHG